jgi:hypothetical protein
VGRSWRGPTALAALAVVVSTVAGCGNHSGAASTAAVPSLSAPSPVTGSPDPAATGRSALDAYRGMWRAYQQALTTSDPSDAGLAQYATGSALSYLQQGVRSVKDQGLAQVGAMSLSPRVTGFSPASAPTDTEVTDCLDSSQSHLVRTGPGPAYSDSPGGHRRVSATVRKQADGGWKVTDFGVQAVGSC